MLLHCIAEATEPKNEAIQISLLNNKISELMTNNASPLPATSFGLLFSASILSVWILFLLDLIRIPSDPSVRITLFAFEIFFI